MFSEELSLQASVGPVGSIGASHGGFGSRTDVPESRSQPQGTGDRVEISDQARALSSVGRGASDSAAVEFEEDYKLELKLSPEELRAMTDPGSPA